MQKIVAPIILALFTSLAASATDDGAKAMRARIEAALQQGQAQQAPALRNGRKALLDLERTEITADVAHYRLEIQVGPGEHDKIELHRIVRELAPWVPARRLPAAFLVHGDAWGFEAAYLTSLATGEIDDTQSISVFLAQNDIDVWGIGFRWSLVPRETTDLSFMADWGLGTSTADLDLALGTARFLRGMTGSGFGPVHLLGWSRGGTVGWAQLGAETQRHHALRHVRGFIAMEHSFKTDDEAFHDAECASYAAFQDQIDAGSFASDFGIVADIGDLATSAPEDPSPFFPILSNADLAEWIGADVAGGALPNFHSVGGVIDPATFETELSYTRSPHWFSFLSQVSTYQPLRINLDGAAIVCDEIDSPFDDHLEEITVPVLYLGVAGGFGSLGLYTTTLIDSTDVTSAIISESAQPARDLGHNDVFLADDAVTLLWQPILDWIETH